MSALELLYRDHPDPPARAAIDFHASEAALLDERIGRLRDLLRDMMRERRAHRHRVRRLAQRLECRQ